MVRRSPGHCPLAGKKFSVAIENLLLVFGNLCLSYLDSYTIIPSLCYECVNIYSTKVYMNLLHYYCESMLSMESMLMRRNSSSVNCESSIDFRSLHVRSLLCSSRLPLY